jgi:ketosteroid isomerase-like protein
MSDNQIAHPFAKDDCLTGTAARRKRSKYEAISTFIAFGVLCTGSAGVAASSPGETAILKIEQDMAMTQTVDGVMAAWDNAVIWYDIVPGEVDGLEAARKNYGEELSHVTNVRTKILRIKVVADANIGFAFSTQHLVADGKNGEPNLDFVFRETDCFQRKGGRWRLTHQQLSLPVDLGTGKAVLDSK